MAYPQAIAIVKACVDTAMQLGLPEAQLPLAQAAILLATAPKSNSVVAGINHAWGGCAGGPHRRYPPGAAERPRGLLRHGAGSRDICIPTTSRATGSASSIFPTL